jgi:hypothetical protein
VVLDPAHPNHSLQIQASQPLPGVVNYLIGRDPRAWHTDIPTYAQVTYRNVVPGLDLALSATFDDPRATPIWSDAVTRISVTAWARLVQRFTTLGWQVTATGSHTPMAQPGTPTTALSYVTYLGGTNNAVGADGTSASGIAVDAQGDAYVTGATTSSDFPVTPGALQSRYPASANSGGSDAFVVKVAPGGDRLLYATFLGGGGVDGGSGIAVDAQGDAYIAGSTSSGDFPVTPGAFRTSYAGDSAGGGDTFVAKLAPAGDHLMYATLLGGSDDAGAGIAVDAQGDAYIAGSTSNYDIPVTPGAFQTTGDFWPQGAFVAKLAPAGNRLLYATYLDGGVTETVNAIAADAQGDAFVTGATASPNFPVTPGAFQTSYNAGARGNEAFVVKLAPAGNRLLYATFLGGSNGNYGCGIAVDAQGDAYISGYTASDDFPVTPGAFQTAYAEGGEAYAAKLAPAGDRLLYATFLARYDRWNDGCGIAVDAQGDAFVTGATTSPNFPVTPGAFQTRYGGSDEDAFAAKLAPAGNHLLYATFLGGNDDDIGDSIAVDAQGGAFVAGETYSSNFPVTPGAFQMTVARGSRVENAFVAHLVLPPSIPAALAPSSPPPAGTPHVRYFPATHHTLAGPFLAFWHAHGDYTLLGLPLSQPFTEDAQTVQYTERARLVLSHGVVSLSPLGNLLTAGRDFPPVSPVPSTASRLYFPATGHTLAAPFLAFWQQHQGSRQFGPPISQPLHETTDDGTGRVYLVQYFTNTRLEYHPESSQGLYRMQVSRLGYAYLHLRGLI